jgi:ribosomal protein S27E
MADFSYVPCPKCKKEFMVGEEFFRIPEAYCHCPFCGNEFKVGVAAQLEAEQARTAS